MIYAALAIVATIVGAFILFLPRRKPTLLPPPNMKDTKREYPDA